MINSKKTQRAEPAGLPVRRLVIEVIDQVLKAHQSLDDAFDNMTTLIRPSAKLDARDMALAKAIAQVFFRHKNTLEEIIESRCDQGLPSKSGPLKLILMTAAAQILHMDVADHAAVDVAVTLTREDNRSAPYHTLVNAVLRRITREKLHVQASLDHVADTPEWMYTRWISAYGEKTAHALTQAHQQLAALDISVKSDPQAWAKRLNAVVLPTGSLRLLTRDTPIPELDGFEDGAWWVQDVGASLAAKILNPQKGERILDMCAAPGGKTAQLATAGAHVVALDRSEKRLKRLNDNMARLQLHVEVVVADGGKYQADPFDAVLLDAPCSATGTLRRHPEISWIRSQSDILKLAQTQSRLLDQAAHLVKKNGRLIYCTCSLEREEGEEQIASFLKRNPHFKREPIMPLAVAGLEHAITSHGDVRTLPSMTLGNDIMGIDGFFISRLVRL